MSDLNALAQFCTVRQLEVLEAVINTGSQKKAAKALKVNIRSVERTMAAIRQKAAMQGFSPEHDLTHAAAPGQRLQGASTLYRRGEAEPVLQWVKTSRDEAAAQDALIEFANSLAESVKGMAPIAKPPKHADDDLMCVYPMGDPHFGMYAWWQDAGADFDLAIAEKLTKGAVDRLVASAPSAATALLLNLGDMFHTDNQTNQTSSGNQLDVDGRFPKVQQVGLMAKIYCIDRMLEKHQKVIVRINPGNHDKNTSKTLALMLSCYYHNEPRVEIDLSPAACWYYRFGKVLIGSTHGDTIKGKDAVGVMAADRAEDWGKSLHRYWYLGHVHHHDSKEYPGAIVEYFRTLAARDAWHQGQGYRAGRDMRLIVLHREHGEIERHRVDVGMLE